LWRASWWRKVLRLEVDRVPVLELVQAAAAVLVAVPAAVAADNVVAAAAESRHSSSSRSMGMKMAR
jgi:hypothetical protein